MRGHHEGPVSSERDDESVVHDAARSRQGPALLLGSVSGALLVVAVVAGVVQNEDPVRFEWLVLDIDAPLWLLLLVTLATGAVMWGLVGAGLHRARHRSSRRRAAIEERERRGARHTVRTFS